MADPIGQVFRIREDFRIRAQRLAEDERLAAAKEGILVAQHDGLAETGHEARDRVHRTASKLHALARQVHEQAAELHQRNVNRRDALEASSIESRSTNEAEQRLVQLSQLSWRARGRGASICAAEIDQPIHGYQFKMNNPRSRRSGAAQPVDAIPLVMSIALTAQPIGFALPLLRVGRGWFGLPRRMWTKRHS